ncbi:MAG: hypothetical protein ILP23_07265 [Paludibacteraceae bacterium]|nr:hypothetical protein [Paludibacteraceae bacterium]
MKTLIIAGLACALMLGSCGKGKSDGAAQTASDSDSAVAETSVAKTIDTVVIDRINDIYQDKKHNMYLELVVDFPVNGPQPLLDSIRACLDNCLGSTYKGDMADGKSFMKHYHNDILKNGNECKEDASEQMGHEAADMRFSQTFKATKVYEDANVVTYSLYDDYYCGGMYGALNYNCKRSFFKPSGQSVTVRTLFADPDSPELRNLIGTRYKAECEKIGIDIEDAFEGTNFDEFPFPNLSPYIENGCVVFSYGKYDMNGAFVDLSFKASALSKFMTGKAKALFD